MLSADQWAMIRKMYHVDKVSQREIGRRLKHAPKTVRKALRAKDYAEYASAQHKKRPSKLDPYKADIAYLLKEYPDRQVLVEGHTDSTGTEQYNLGLSQRRADSVVQFLTLNGIAPERAIARGYGKAYPVAGNETTAGRQRNRRVEIVILDPGEKAAEEARPIPPQ